MRVTITKMLDRQKTSKAGKPYTSRSIKTNEHGERWLSGFKGKENDMWREGDTVEIEIEEKGEYLNFSVPKTATSTAPVGDLNRVEVKVDNNTAQLNNIGGILTNMRTVLADILSKLAKDDDEPGF